MIFFQFHERPARVTDCVRIWCGTSEIGLTRCRAFGTQASVKTLAILCLLALAGCVAGSNEQAGRADAAWKRADAVPFEQRPAFYAQMEREGVITPVKRQEWDGWWHAQVKARQEQAKRDRWMDSLSPRERLALEMQKRAFDAQRDRQNAVLAAQAQQQAQADQQNRRQAIGAALGAMNNQFQAQQAAQAAQTEAYRESLLRRMQPAPTPPSYRATSRQAYPGGPVETTIEPY